MTHDQPKPISPNHTLTDRDRAWFDALVAEAIEELPRQLKDLLDTCPVVVIDAPDAQMLTDLGVHDITPKVAAEFCGLHTGISDTDLSVENSGELPSTIHLFRRGILTEARADNDRSEKAADRVYQEIMITLLHEIGHQFGLDESDLARLGYD